MNLKKGEIFLNTAIIVYQSTPMFGRNMLPNNAVLGNFNQTKLVTQLNTELLERNLPWEAVLDDSIADIKVIAQEADAIICVPGLQKLFDIGNYPKEKVFYLDSLDYHNLQLDNVLNFLEALQH